MTMPSPFTRRSGAITRGVHYRASYVISDATLSEAPFDRASWGLPAGSGAVYAFPSGRDSALAAFKAYLAHDTGKQVDNVAVTVGTAYRGQDGLWSQPFVVEATVEGDVDPMIGKHLGEAIIGGIGPNAFAGGYALPDALQAQAPKRGVYVEGMKVFTPRGITYSFVTPSAPVVLCRVNSAQTTPGGESASTVECDPAGHTPVPLAPPPPPSPRRSSPGTPWGTYALVAVAAGAGVYLWSKRSPRR